MTITDEQASALGRRAAAWKHWRWLSGMAVCERSGLRPTVEQALWWNKHTEDAQHLRPDLRDPATQGCCLTLISEHNHRRSMWDALADVHHRMGRGLSYPEALVEAMEACMTATEIQRRVDAWLAARADWASETARRRFLVGQWRHVCPVFGADSDAAKGVLVGMVAEAWGCNVSYDYAASKLIRTTRVRVRLQHQSFGAETLIDALTDALEAAP